jgi:hypothetical protein
MFRYNPCYDRQIILNNEPVEQVSSFKYHVYGGSLKPINDFNMKLSNFPYKFMTQLKEHCVVGQEQRLS